MADAPTALASAASTSTDAITAGEGAAGSVRGSRSQPRPIWTSRFLRLGCALPAALLLASGIIALATATAATTGPFASSTPACTSVSQALNPAGDCTDTVTSSLTQGHVGATETSASFLVGPAGAATTLTATSTGCSWISLLAPPATVTIEVYEGRVIQINPPSSLTARSACMTTVAESYPGNGSNLGGLLVGLGVVVVICGLAVAGLLAIGNAIIREEINSSIHGPTGV